MATDGTVTDGPYPESKAYIGGFSVVDVPSREEALSGLCDRRRLPLCAGGSRVRAGLYALIKPSARRRRKRFAFRRSPTIACASVRMTPERRLPHGGSGGRRRGC